MKKFLFPIFLLFICANGWAQTHLYEHPNIDQYIARQNKVAILPFKTSITLRPKDMKSMTNEQIMKLEEDEGYSIQSAMHSWFLKREKTGKLKVSFLDPMTTNAKLRKMGVDFTNLQDYTPDELADMLEVDAIIMGTFETNKPMSEGASLALGLLAGFYGSTNKAVLNMSIYDSEDGTQIANYNKGISGSMGSSTEDLINILMRKASRRISYTE
ncbi:hypothetical protein [Algoriphagus sp. CAU 1675]|uniref:hypothetical protein n=1 Tax=Algoriphagus sp. CAU 1675 TaxID=3032597 RepID=UPI0023DB37EE|nr:hypothetical protein [Algoriphagus sp. CAU 1675]MDF2159031.1 hypothetical protein [Algoriphagus sp. CAU 1675]